MAENNTESVAVTVKEGSRKTSKDHCVGMTRKSEKVINPVAKYAAQLSIIIIVLSILILFLAIWLFYMKDYDCEKLFGLPRLQTGIATGLIFVFFISNIVVFLRSRLPAPGFLMVMVPLIVMFTMGLALVGANKLQSRRIMATPMWFKGKVRNNENWENVKSCIFSTGTCDDLVSRTVHLKSFDFSIKKLSSIEAGCCKPPSMCGMEYVNATFWTKVEGAVDETEEEYSDCGTWQNDPSSLCYNCRTCRDGFVRVLESKWRTLGLLLILMALLLIIAHLLLFVMVMWGFYYHQAPTHQEPIDLA